MRSITIAALSLLVLAFGTTTARANTITADIGDSYESGSWVTGFGFSGGPVGLIDTLEAFIVPASDTGAGPFELDGMTNFNDASWSAALVNPEYSLATGTYPGSLVWDFTFDGNLADGLIIDLLGWSGGVGGDLTVAISVSYSAGAATVLGIDSNSTGVYDFLYSSDGSQYNRAAPIPEPSGALMFGTAVLLAAAAIRRRSVA